MARADARDAAAAEDKALRRPRPRRGTAEVRGARHGMRQRPARMRPASTTGKGPDMTDITGQPPATPAGASADYQTTIRVKYSPGALFDALTTVSGLAAWWNPCTGSGDAGGALRFFMNSPEPLLIHVDE